VEAQGGGLPNAQADKSGGGWVAGLMQNFNAAGISLFLSLLRVRGMQNFWYGIT
jgi:hypothetical protein